MPKQHRIQVVWTKWIILQTKQVQITTGKKKKRENKLLQKSYYSDTILHEEIDCEKAKEKQQVLCAREADHNYTSSEISVQQIRYYLLENQQDLVWFQFHYYLSENQSYLALFQFRYYLSENQPDLVLYQFQFQFQV